MKTTLSLLVCCLAALMPVAAREHTPCKPRILVSTDIGGTDPDDNQSMIHLLMYSDCFDIEGIVSSPSFGNGSKEEIWRMIEIYRQDYDRLAAHNSGLVPPDSLRVLCKQGRRGAASYKGYDEPTEGSQWIVSCARRESDRPLYVLVWGALDDVAQALHDAPDICSRIRVYWIGGPNKKWGVNSYAYIAGNFPDLWMIENNASYRGFIGSKRRDDVFNRGYYDHYIKGAGHLGADFIHYYDGLVKMGDTPSLLYMMDGDPSVPARESWGGSFEPLHKSPRHVFDRITGVNDTVQVYAVVEFCLDGPVLDACREGEPCFTLHIDKQQWEGIYAGKGKYVVRYAPKAPATLKYEIRSDIEALNGLQGVIVVGDEWGGDTVAGYPLGDNWYTDRRERDLYEGQWQGSRTVSKWREEVLTDWAVRWGWLR